MAKIRFFVLGLLIFVSESVFCAEAGSDQKPINKIDVRQCQEVLLASGESLNTVSDDPQNQLNPVLKDLRNFLQTPSTLQAPEWSHFIKNEVLRTKAMELQPLVGYQQSRLLFIQLQKEVNPYSQTGDLSDLALNLASTSPRSPPPRLVVKRLNPHIIFRYRHIRNAHFAKFSHDDRWILSGSSDREVKLLQVDNGLQFQLPKIHQSFILDGAFSPDGQFFLTVSFRDGSAVLWSTTDREPIRVFRFGSLFYRYFKFGAPYRLQTGSISRDGKLLLFGDSIGRILILRLTDGKVLRTIKAHSETSLARFSPDGKKIVSAGFNKYGRYSPITLWDTKTGKNLLEIQGHLQAINSLDFSPDGQRVISSSDDGTTRVWDAERGNLLMKIDSSYGEVNWSEYSHHQKYIVTGTKFGVVSILDAHSGRLLKDFFVGSGINSVQFSSDDSRLAVAQVIGVIEIYGLYTMDTQLAASAEVANE